ncbi:outer membrane beta-barrel protein [Kiritimatiellota bacterium B12222]|nr:outer membrane beta-barrel protein [Kiritimatiellota bacterium B12222]
MSIPLVASAQAELSNRMGTWDMGLPFSFSLSDTINGQGGSQIKLKDGFGFGFLANYHFTNQFSLGGSFMWESRDYTATTVNDEGESNKYSNLMDSSTIALNATYYVLPGKFTPFISGMLGYSFVDTNVPNGLPDTNCYYDPWWGYVCNSYVPTKTEDGFSYGVGLGLRGEFSESFAVQLSYNRTWMDIDYNSGTPDFDTIRLDFILTTY